MNELEPCFAAIKIEPQRKGNHERDGTGEQGNHAGPGGNDFLIPLDQQQNQSSPNKRQQDEGG